MAGNTGDCGDCVDEVLSRRQTRHGLVEPSTVRDQIHGGSLSDDVARSGWVNARVTEKGSRTSDFAIPHFRSMGKRKRQAMEDEEAAEQQPGVVKMPQVRSPPEMARTFV